MPKVGALEVLEQIKKAPYLRAVPVVIMTSSSLQPDIAEAYRLGANSYVVKPVEFAAFVEKVEQVGLYWIKTNQGEATAAPVT